MDALLTAMVMWLSVNFGLPPSYDHLAVQLVPPNRTVAARYGAVDSSKHGEVVAVYRDATRTILLSEGRSGETPAELSILVHELVHHLQNEAGQRYPCAAAREKTAYAAQDAWLGLFGRSLESDFGLDKATLMLMTHCTPS
ncbi:MAG: DUF6647 family protein [Pseudomonadota bacterium]